MFHVSVRFALPLVDPGYGLLLDRVVLGLGYEMLLDWIPNGTMIAFNAGPCVIMVQIRLGLFISYHLSPTPLCRFSGWGNKENVAREKFLAYFAPQSGLFYK